MVDGDIEQIDISGPSGLSDGIWRLRKVPSVGVVEFTLADVVRSGIVRDVIVAYSKE